MSNLSNEQRLLLQKPLPAEAIQDQTVTKPIYITERFNEVFGTGQWNLHTDMLDPGTVRTRFEVPQLGILYECIDQDAIIKIGSYLGIGSDVLKGVDPEESKKRWERKIKPLVQAAINDLLDCKNLADLTELKDDLPSYVLESPDFKAAATARYNEVTGNKPVVAPESDQQQQVAPVPQPEEITAPAKPDRPVLENPDVILQNGNPVDVQKFIDAANDPELVNSTLVWLRKKDDEGYNVKPYLSSLHEKAVTTLNLTFNSRERKYYVYVADTKPQTA